MFKTLRDKVLLSSACLAISFGVAIGAYAANYRDDAAPGLADGAGIWANLWNYPDGDLDAYCRNLKAHNIRNLFIQTSRSNTPGVKYPEKLGPLLDACHRNGVRVIAWSFAELFDPESDADKMVEAAEFVSENGEHIDGVAPNLEKNLEAWRIEKYSKRVREKLGPNYPMVAVVYSPLNKCFEVKRISWPLLAKYYDVIAPMIYWNSKYEKIEPYSYTVSTIQTIRKLTGKADMEISAIGDGMGSGGLAIADFLRACHDAEATGISLYPEQKMTPEQMTAISHHRDHIPKNARFRLAAFREYVGSGNLNPPAENDPSRPIPRRDFYKLLVRQMYPTITTKRNQPRPAGTPTVAECKAANSEEAFQILVSLGLVSDPIENNNSIQGILDSQIEPEEALSLIAKMLDGERHKLDRAGHHSARLDRWFVPPAIGASDSVTRKNDGRTKAVNYLEASQMILQASSALH